jgi:hypothetical protein
LNWIWFDRVWFDDHLRFDRFVRVLRTCSERACDQQQPSPVVKGFHGVLSSLESGNVRQLEIWGSHCGCSSLWVELQDERDKCSVGNRDKTDLKQCATTKVLQCQRNVSGASRTRNLRKEKPPGTSGGSGRQRDLPRCGGFLSSQWQADLLEWVGVVD